jgi:diacylglycerol kinase family enzyme
LTDTARLDDGVMDLWLCTGETLGDSVQLAWDLFSGRHVQSDQVEQIPFRSLRLEADSPTFIQIDGEPAGPRQGVKIEVRPHALNVLIPAETPHPLFGSSPVS